ncbi:MAG: WhiB family transcriptional regulator [Mycobacteriaceae bacterium]|nr:WhiB family transcriptional regulator [Mycobacteriaceae bacterium]
MAQPTPIADSAGLCQYGGDPNFWFRFEDSARAAAVCVNCPVRRACAQAALSVQATDGVWAGVRLPGNRFPEKLDQARDQLKRVIVGMGHQPESHRRRALMIRAALHYSANLERTGA